MNTEDYRLTEQEINSFTVIPYGKLGSTYEAGRSLGKFEGMQQAQYLILAKFSAARDEKIEAMQKEIEELKELLTNAQFCICNTFGKSHEMVRQIEFHLSPPAASEGGK